MNAVPSYMIAIVWLGLWSNPFAHLAMIAAVVTFIVAYTVLTSLSEPLSRPESLLSRALRIGLILRIICTIWTLVLFPTGVFLLFTPDFWCGRFAFGAVDIIYRIFGYETTLIARAQGSGSIGELPTTGFMEVYLTTLLEGAILSLMLISFSLVAVIILQAKERKKLYSNAS